MESYFRTGIFDDAIDTLNFAAGQVVAAKNNPASIKWAVVAVHAALQGFMALTLDRGNGLLVMSEKDAAAWLSEYRSGNKPKALPGMDRFLNLHKKVGTRDCMQGLTGAVPFAITPAHRGRIQQLNSLRNNFIHFNLGGWSIETSGLNEIFRAAMDLISFLQSSVLFPWHRRTDIDGEQARVRAAIQEILAVCETPFIVQQSAN